MTAAPVVAPARDADDQLVADELIRETRERRERPRFEARVRVTFWAVAIAFAVAATASAVLLRQGPAFSWVTAAVLVAVYAVVSRVQFELATGSFVPTQLVLVPMLFALPVGSVPLAVSAACVVGGIAVRWRTVRSPDRIVSLASNATHALGPAVVLALAGGLPLRWSAWPVYVAALAAQFGADFAGAAVSAGIGHGIGVRRLVRVMSSVWMVDAALAPIGLAVAFATLGHAWLVVLVLPLVGLLRHFAHERQLRIDNALELSDAYRGTAFLLGDVVEADDAYTGSHSRHVVDLVVGVSDRLGLDGQDRRNAEFVALLHDVGKIKIPAAIINKPGPLTEEERAIINTHTIEGEQMLERVGGLLARVGRIVRSCHERWDGEGYPDRLVSSETPLIARIVCACDAFSAMTTDRPYRKARSIEDALEELQRCSGTQFDPQVVDALVAVALTLR